MQKENRVILNHRFVGRMLGDILSLIDECPEDIKADVDRLIQDNLNQLSEEDRKWILLSVAIRMAELGKKGQALRLALSLDLGIEELPSEKEALNIALNGGIVALVDDIIVGYNGPNTAVRKLMHELKA
jgi:hypothetical protein